MLFVTKLRYFAIAKRGVTSLALMSIKIMNERGSGKQLQRIKWITQDKKVADLLYTCLDILQKGTLHFPLQETLDHRIEGEIIVQRPASEPFDDSKRRHLMIPCVTMWCKKGTMILPYLIWKI